MAKQGDEEEGRPEKTSNSRLKESKAQKMIYIAKS